MMEKSYLDKRKADIQYNLDVINEKIAESAIKSGRKPEDVCLMAVTKTVNPVMINHRSLLMMSHRSVLRGHMSGYWCRCYRQCPLCSVLP